MKRKMSSEELIKKYSSSPPPALREYLLLPSAPFLETFGMLADKYLGNYDSFMYQHYTNIINVEYAEDDSKKKTRISDLLIKAHRERSEELSTAILYTIFLYPIKIIRAQKTVQKESDGFPEIPDDPEDWGLPFK